MEWFKQKLKKQWFLVIKIKSIKSGHSGKQVIKWQLVNKNSGHHDRWQDQSGRQGQAFQSARDRTQDSKVHWEILKQKYIYIYDYF